MIVQSIRKVILLMGIHMDSKNQNFIAGQQKEVEPIQLQRGEATATVTDIKEHDILLGRGKSNANHIGNVLFQGKVLMIIDIIVYSYRINNASQHF